MPCFLPRFLGSGSELSVCGTHQNLDLMEILCSEITHPGSFLACTAATMVTVARCLVTSWSTLPPVAAHDVPHHLSLNGIDLSVHELGYSNLAAVCDMNMVYTRRS